MGMTPFLGSGDVVKVPKTITPGSIMESGSMQSPTDPTYNNTSVYDDNGEAAAAAAGFFQTYYSTERFIAECILATVATACNVIALVINRGHTYQHPAYHSLFRNLSISNALAASASWLTNNVMYLFSRELLSMHNICHVLVVLLSLNLFSTAFGLISGMTLVGFGIIHYLAICWPLRYDGIMTRARIRAGIVIIWLMGPIISFWPIPAHYINLRFEPTCSVEYIEYLTLVGSDFSMAVLFMCYITLTCMCLRIYYEIRKLQRRLAANLWVDDLQYEKKALITIVLLVGTMTLFFLPYSIVYLFSLNSWTPSLNEDPAVLYYMMLLPYLKYATDPVIYGKRMLGLQQEFRRKVVKVCCTGLADRLRTSSNVREDCTKKGQVYQMVTIV